MSVQAIGVNILEGWACASLVNFMSEKDRNSVSGGDSMAQELASKPSAWSKPLSEEERSRMDQESNHDVQKSTADTSERTSSHTIEKYLRKRSYDDIRPMESTTVMLRAKAINTLTSTVVLSKWLLMFENRDLEVFFIAHQNLKFRQFRMYFTTLINVISLFGLMSSLIIPQAGWTITERIFESPFLYSIIVCSGLTGLLRSKRFLINRPLLSSLLYFCAWSLLPPIWVVGLSFSENHGLATSLVGIYILVSFVSLMVTYIPIVPSLAMFVVVSTVTISLTPYFEESPGRVVFSCFFLLILYGMNIRFRDWYERNDFVHILKLRKENHHMQVFVRGSVPQTPFNRSAPSTANRGSYGMNSFEESSTGKLSVRILFLNDQFENDRELSTVLLQSLQKFIAHRMYNCSYEDSSNCITAGMDATKVTTEIELSDMIVFCLSQNSLKLGKLRNAIDYAYENKKEMVVVTVGGINPSDFPSGLKMTLRNVQFLQFPLGTYDERMIAKSSIFLMENWLRKTMNGKRAMNFITLAKQHALHESIRKASSPSILRQHRKFSQGFRDAMEMVFPWASSKSSGKSHSIQSPTSAKQEQNSEPPHDIVVDSISDMDSISEGSQNLDEEFKSLEEIKVQEIQKKGDTKEILAPIKTSSISEDEVPRLGQDFFAVSWTTPQKTMIQREISPFPALGASSVVRSKRASSTFSTSRHVAIRKQKQNSIFHRNKLQPIISQSASVIRDELVVEVVLIDPYKLSFKERKLETAYREHRNDLVDQRSMYILGFVSFLFLGRSVVLSISAFNSVNFLWTMLGFLMILPILIIFLFGLTSTKIHRHASPFLFSSFILCSLLLFQFHQEAIRSADDVLPNASYFLLFEFFLTLISSMFILHPTVVQITSGGVLFTISSLISLSRDYDFSEDPHIIYGFLAEVVFLTLFVVLAYRSFNRMSRLLFLLDQRLAWENLGIDIEYERHDSLIAYSPQLCKIFISYKREDISFASKLTDSLRKEGFSVWIDEDIRAGQNWRDEICDAIDESSVVLFIVTPASVQSKFCQEEIGHAYDVHKPVLPVVLADAGNDIPSQVSLIISNVQWVSFENRKFRHGWIDLVEAIHEIQAMEATFE